MSSLKYQTNRHLLRVFLIWNPIHSKRLPHRQNRGIPKPTYEPDLSTKVKYPMSNYESNKSFVNQLSTVVIPNSVQEALVDPRWKARLVSRYPHQSCLKSSILKIFRQVGHV